MRNIERLSEDISNARRFNAARQRGEPSRRVRGVLAEAGSTCLRQADVDARLARMESLLKKFAQLFPSCREVFLLRAPGRINLIGEHTDYNGLPVFPMAINRDILLAASLDNLVVHRFDNPGTRGLKLNHPKL